MMTDQPPDESERPNVTIGAVLDGIVGSMSADDFAALAERTGHGADPKTKASQAIAQLVQRGNLPTDGTTADVLRAIRKR